MEDTQNTNDSFINIAGDINEEEVVLKPHPLRIAEEYLKAEKYKASFRNYKDEELSVMQERSKESGATYRNMGDVKSPRDNIVDHYVKLYAEGKRKKTAPAIGSRKNTVQYQQAEDFRLGITGNIQAYGVSLLNYKNNHPQT